MGGPFATFMGRNMLIANFNKTLQIDFFQCQLSNMLGFAQNYDLFVRAFTYSSLPTPLSFFLFLSQIWPDVFTLTYIGTYTPYRSPS